MAQTQAQKVGDWVRAAILDPDKDGKCTSVAIVHMREGMDGDVVHVIKLGDKQWDTEALGESLYSQALEFSEELPGMQHFCLLAFYANRSQPQYRKPFRVQGYLDTGGMGTEAPTPTGITQQVMRHLEVQTQTYTRKDSILFETMSKTISDLSHMAANLRKENVEMFGLAKELIMAQVESRHTGRMEELKYQRESTERAQLMKAVPGLLNAATGREVVPQSTEDTALVEMMIDAMQNLGGEAIAVLEKLKLPGPAAMALASRVQRGMQSRQLAQHARTAGNGIDPEQDAVGGPNGTH